MIKTEEAMKNDVMENSEKQPKMMSSNIMKL